MGKTDDPTREYLKMVARMIRAGGRRVAKADPEHLAQLARLKVDLDQATRVAVEGLRSSGFTWASIAEATGTTRQSAWEKWGQ